MWTNVQHKKPEDTQKKFFSELVDNLETLFKLEDRYFAKIERKKVLEEDCNVSNPRYTS